MVAHAGNGVTSSARNPIEDPMVAIARGTHLLPFRTEKLSPLAPMVLPQGGRVGRRLSLKSAL